MKVGDRMKKIQILPKKPKRRKKSDYEVVYDYYMNTFTKNQLVEMFIQKNIKSKSKLSEVAKSISLFGKITSSK